jgi:hypothetical protein
VTIGHWAYLGVGLEYTTPVPSTPAGWTLIQSLGTANNTSVNIGLYKRQIQSGDASTSVTLIASGGNTGPKVAVMTVFDGDGVTFVQDAILLVSVSGTNVTWSAVTMVSGQKTLRFAAAINSSAQPVFTWNNSGSLTDTSRQAAALSAGGNVMTVGMADSGVSSGGTESSETVSWTPPSLRGGVCLVLGAVPAPSPDTKIFGSIRRRSSLQRSSF